MATIDDQYDAALAKLTLYAQPDVPPMLSASELAEILLGEQRLAQWEDETDYEYGQVIAPTIRNGHRYRCIQAGTSGSTEPTWVTSTGATLTEGESDPQLKWVEDSSDYASAFNVRAAIHAAWMMKAAKASALYATGVNQGSFRHDQVYEHCLKMAEKFAPIGIP